jgi:hypothetical protein
MRNAQVPVLATLAKGYGLLTDAQNSKAGPYSTYRKAVFDHEKEKEKEWLKNKNLLTDR